MEEYEPTPEVLLTDNIPRSDIDKIKEMCRIKSSSHKQTTHTTPCTATINGDGTATSINLLSNLS